MKNIVLSIIVFVFALNADNNFNKIVESLIEAQLKNIPQPSKEIKLHKDQFETSTEFNIRVKKVKKEQNKIVITYKKKYASKIKKAKYKAIKKALQYTWGKPIISDLKYDADNGYFTANISFSQKQDFSKKVAIKVAREYARNFYKDASHLKAQAVFDYDGSSVRLKSIVIPHKNQNYVALFTNINIDDTKVAVKLTNNIRGNTNVNTNITVAKNAVNTFDSSHLINFNELDNLLKKAPQARINKKKWLFVVGIEKYEYTDNISFAKRSAQMFVKMAQKRFGVSRVNSYVMINDAATQARIKTNMKKMLRRVKKGDTIYFYYNGHGIPVPSLNNAPFILASDTEPDFVADEKFFALQNIYNKLSDSKAEKIVAVVDSCFSGVTDGKSILKGVAATKMVAKSVHFNKEKMVVLSAGKANQYSNQYKQKGYRLFSFFVMKNILEGVKDIKTLYQKTKSETYDTSIEEYGDNRTQEPTMDGNYRMMLW